MWLLNCSQWCRMLSAWVSCRGEREVHSYCCIQNCESNAVLLPMPPSFFLHHPCQELVPMSESNLVRSLLRWFEVLVKPHTMDEKAAKENKYLKVFIIVSTVAWLHGMDKQLIFSRCENFFFCSELWPNLTLLFRLCRSQRRRLYVFSVHSGWVHLCSNLVTWC